MRIAEALLEMEKADYNNWDHQESADYSKYLEKPVSYTHLTLPTNREV